VFTAPISEALGSICNTLAPSDAMLCWIAYEDPCPISIIAMTAAIPMMMPRHVNTDRIAFRRNACSAVRKVR